MAPEQGEQIDDAGAEPVEDDDVLVVSGVTDDDDGEAEPAVDDDAGDASESDGDDKAATAKDDDGLDGLKAQFAEFKESAEREKADLQKEVNRLGYALRKAEKQEPTQQQDTFTDAQLLQMMKDHQDEPEVLFQVVRQMQKQAGESIKKDAKTEAETSNKKQELVGIANNVFPGVLDEGSNFKGEIDNTAAYLGLDNNPYRDVLSLGVMALKNMPNLIENIKAQVRKEALAPNSEKARKKAATATSLADTGRKTGKTAQLPSGISETAKRLGMTASQQRIYAKMMQNASKSSVVMTD